MIFGLPLGTWALLVLDPIALRWCMAVLVLSLVPLLASGWRYHGRPTVSLSLGVGALSGLCNGMASIGGMPLAVFWLGAQRNDRRPVNMAPGNDRPGFTPVYWPDRS